MKKSIKNIKINKNNYKNIYEVAIPYPEEDDFDANNLLY